VHSKRTTTLFSFVTVFETVRKQNLNAPVNLSPTEESWTRWNKSGWSRSFYCRIRIQKRMKTTRINSITCTDGVRFIIDTDLQCFCARPHCHWDERCGVVGLWAQNLSSDFSQHFFVTQYRTHARDIRSLRENCLTNWDTEFNTAPHATYIWKHLKSYWDVDLSTESFLRHTKSGSVNRVALWNENCFWQQMRHTC
jgi:hypothetical protein